MGALAELGYALLPQVVNTTRGRNNDMHDFGQPHHVVFQVGASCGRHDLEVQELAQVLQNVRSLQRKLSSGHQDHRCNRAIVLGSLQSVSGNQGTRAGPSFRDHHVTQ